MNDNHCLSLALHYLQAIREIHSKLGSDTILNDAQLREMELSVLTAMGDYYD